MVEILEGKESRFCFPLLKLKEELLKQIKWNPSTQAMYINGLKIASGLS